MDETESANFGKIVKSKAKYGSVNKSSHTNDVFMKYPIDFGDTIQGISLKFGVTVDTIKRANKIWTNDSLYLRDYLLIPVPNKVLQNGYSSNGIHLHQNGACGGESADDGAQQMDKQYEIITRQDLMRTAKPVPRSQSCMESIQGACDTPAKNTQTQNTETSANDFLSKFDMNIAQIKRNVERLDANTNFPEDDTNPLNMLPKRRSVTLTRRPRRSMEGDEFNLDLNSAPDLAFVSGGNTILASGRLRTSNERLQRANEELFKL